MQTNISVGIIGHVDSGKTSLAKGLSTFQSTAGFDKHPESQRRGITLDVGFSKFDSDEFQVTLVDCPGHAAFIKTVLTGLNIVDLIILVIDGEKMFQQQTYESLVLMELLKKPAIAVINKTDKLNQQQIETNLAILDDLLKKTKIKHIKQIACSAIGDLVSLRQLILDSCKEFKEKILKKRDKQKQEPFLAQFEHQFVIQNVGTVFTSTVLEGGVTLGQKIWYRDEELTVKSLQVFKQDVQEAKTGDRVGICVKNVKVEEERGVLTAQRVPTAKLLQIEFSFIKYFKHQIKQGMNFIINFGHESIGGKLYIFKQLDFQQAEVGAEAIQDFSYKETFQGIIVLESVCQFIPEGKLLGLKLDVDKNTSRIVFSGTQIRIVDEELLNKIHFVSNRTVELEVTKRKENEIVFKTNQVDVEGLEIYQNEIVVGKVMGRFGQEKWKGEVGLGEGPFTVKLRQSRKFFFDLK